MANGHKHGPVQFDATGLLGKLIAPTFKKAGEGEKERVHGLWDFVRTFLLIGNDKLALTPSQSQSREVAKDVAFAMFKAHDAGMVEEAWNLGFLITTVRNPEAARRGAFGEMGRRGVAGDKKAAKLVEYANFSGVPPIWVVIDSETQCPRVETYAEAAMRNLRVIVKHSSDEVSESYPVYRNSMIRHGFVVDAVGRRVATKALAERTEAKAKKPVVKPAPKAPVKVPEVKVTPKATKPDVAKAVSMKDLSAKLKAL